MSKTVVELAREAIRYYLDTGDVLPPSVTLSGDLPERAATFVSLHEQNGMLRGCIGTIEPTKHTLAEEIIANAISAAFHDPRFWPVTRSELDSLDINVDVLQKPVLETDWTKLDPVRYGIIVATRDGRRGVLLPNIEGVHSVSDQIDICRQKGGIQANEPVEIYKFEVTRYTR